MSMKKKQRLDKTIYSLRSHLIIFAFYLKLDWQRVNKQSAKEQHNGDSP